MQGAFFILYDDLNKNSSRLQTSNLSSYTPTLIQEITLENILTLMNHALKLSNNK